MNAFDDDLQRHSRSQLAGYETERLFASGVVIVGCGAIGQNVALNLALAGVGRLHLVDHDRFEEHNLTRSPLYSRPEAAGPALKAPSVAASLEPLMTAPSPSCLSSPHRVQALGDAVFARAEVVVSAVDSISARGYLADRCRAVGVPLVEAGFHGHQLNLSSFGPGHDEPCYRCIVEEEAGAFSCAHYARAAAEADIVPAIQTGAAVIAGLQAEEVIAWLHGQPRLRGERLYFDVAATSMTRVRLMVSSACTGRHLGADRPTRLLLDPPLSRRDSLQTLLERVHRGLGPASVRLPAYVIEHAVCTTCCNLALVCAPEWAWLELPTCINCGGPWPLTIAGDGPRGHDWIPTELESELLSRPLAVLGCGPGTIIDVVVREHDAPLTLELISGKGGNGMQQDDSRVQ